MKNYCKHCGAKLDVDQEHICPKTKVWRKIKGFFSELFNPQEEVGDSDFYERGKNIVPDSISPDNGEIVIKQYDLAVLRSRLKLTRAEGRMQITNKRVLFRATGKTPAGKTVYQSEFSMDKIDGIEIRKDYRFMILDFFINTYIGSIAMILGGLLGALFVGEGNIVMALFSLLVGMGACVPFFIIKKRYLLKVLIESVGIGLAAACCATGIVTNNTGLIVISVIGIAFLYVLYWIAMFLSFFKPNLVVEIKTSGGSPGIQIKRKFASVFLWKKLEENSGFSEILPGKDADLAIKEIGAMISDIKTLGDFGIDKWKA